MAEATCSVDGCGRVHHARDLCETHYVRLRRHGDVMGEVPINLALARRSDAVCTVNGCGRKPLAHGWCVAHYYRSLSPDGLRPGDPIRRYASPYDLPLIGNRDTGCMDWPGSLNTGGYGLAVYLGRPGHAHRFVYEATKGPIPPGMFVCHRCDNPPCCNSDHLFLGTHADNMRDRDAKGRQARGESQGNSKLTEPTVRAIRQQRVDGRTVPSLAAEYGVALGTIEKVIYRSSWKHI